MVQNDENKIIIYSFDFRRIVAFLRNHMKVYTVFVFLFGIGGVIIALFMDSWYKTSIILKPNTQQSGFPAGKLGNLSQFLNIRIPFGEEMTTLYLYPYIIQSDRIIDSLLAKQYYSSFENQYVKLEDILDIKLDSKKKRAAIKWREELKKTLLDEVVGIDLDPDANIIKLEIRLPKDPSVLISFSDTLLAELEEFLLNFKNNNTSETLKYIQFSIDSTYRRLNELEKVYSDFMKNYGNVESPQKKLERAKLEMELDALRNIYIQLKEKYELTKIEEINTMMNFAVIKNAEIPYKKFKPKRVVIVVLMGMLGFIVASIFIYTREIFYQ